MIVIVNYGLGNLGSIQNMLKKINIESTITGDLEIIDKAKKLILPGVGSFDAGMEGINKLGLLPVLNRKVIQERIPVLGICLGMQLMLERSEEGKKDGLGWIKGEVKRFPVLEGYKVPHMGWNTVKIVHKNKITDGFEDNYKYYFVHSYYAQPTYREDILMSTCYEFEFASAVSHENISGVQFHPEKSHKYGMNLFRNFAKL